MGLKDVFKKSDIESILSDLSRILDPQDMEIVIVRDKSCEALFACAGAYKRMGCEQEGAHSCKNHYTENFKGLCDICPYGGKH